MMSSCINPPVRHWYSEPRPGAPLNTWTSAPWELLREHVPKCPELRILSTEPFCPFSTFVELVRKHKYDTTIDWIMNHETKTLMDCGFFDKPPARSFSVAWSMILRVRHAQRMHDLVLHDGDMSLVIQRFIDTHLRLCALIFRHNLTTDQEVFGHPDYHHVSPLDLRGAYNGGMPNISRLIMSTNVFFDSHPNSRTPVGQLVHFLCKQWPHPCASRGYSTIMKRAFSKNKAMMYLVLDIVLVYCILGNYVIHWSNTGSRMTPRRQTFFHRAAIVEHFMALAWSGSKKMEKFLREVRSIFVFSSRLFVMDLLELHPNLIFTLKNIYSLGEATVEVDHVLARFREDMTTCDWQALLRPGPPKHPAFERAIRAKRHFSQVMKQTKTSMAYAHGVMLIYLFKLRKYTFCGIIAHTLTKILQNEGQARGAIFVPDGEVYELETDPVLSPLQMRCIQSVALHIAPKNDGYFPIAWLLLLGVKRAAFDEIRDIYCGYEADMADHPIHERMLTLFLQDGESVVIAQRLFAMVERMRGRKIVATTLRTKRRHMAVLMARYKMIDASVAARFKHRLGVCYYCECGTWISPVSDPSSNSRSIHALALARGAFDPVTCKIYCGRSRKPECSMPAKKINMIGKMMFMNGAWYCLCTESGCGILTKMDPQRVGPFGPVCGNHPPEYPRVPVEANPKPLMLAKVGGNAYEHRLTTQVPTQNVHHGMPCAYCNVRPLREGGDYTMVYDPDGDIPFGEIYLCPRHANARNKVLGGLQEKKRLFESIADIQRKKYKN